VYQDLAIPLGRGLNVRDLPESLEDGQATEIRNFVAVGRDRIAPRKADKLVASGFAGKVIAIVPFPVGTYNNGIKRGGVVIAYDGTARLYSVDKGGGNPFVSATLWIGAAEPVVTVARLGKMLFIGDGGAGNYATKIFRGDNSLFGPTFDWAGDPDETPTYEELKAKVLVQHSNMIFAAGDPGPEVIRFSYLGLSEDDPEDQDFDAGNPTDSLELFSREDYFALTEAGVPIVGMASGSGRLVICTPYQTHLLFGSDRDGFSATLLDNERGLISTRAILEANGSVWGWSAKHGPWMYDGQMRDLSAPIAPLIQEMATRGNLIFAAHAPDAREIRWYAGDLRLAYNYDLGEWFTHPSATEYWCFGRISPFHDDAGSGGGVGGGPSGAPSGLGVSGVGQTNATLSWVNADVLTGTQTDVEIQRDGGAWMLAGTVGNGISQLGLSDLLTGRSYVARVRHKRGGLYSGYSNTASFSTQAQNAAPNAPTNLIAYDDPWAGNPGIQLAWNLSNQNVTTEIQRAITSIGTYVTIATAPEGVVWYRDHTVLVDITYSYRVRAVSDAGTSAWSNVATETATGNAP
jgi:hypothetical protein